MDFRNLEVITEKNKVLIGALAALLVFGLIGAFFVLKKKRGEMISPFSEESKEEEKVEFLLWDDEAGFTFEYPEGLYIDDHPEDMENYAHLNITSTKETEGQISILVNDSPTKTIDEWVEEEEKQVSEASIIDTILAGEPAKKLLFDEPKRVLIAAIDPYEGLFLLELQPGGEDYWQKVFDQIVSSFAFKPLSEEEEEVLEETGGGGGGNVVYEEEETIE